jgi:hypothetical protein
MNGTFLIALGAFEEAGLARASEIAKNRASINLPFLE